MSGKIELPPPEGPRLKYNRSNPYVRNEKYIDVILLKIIKIKVIVIKVVVIYVIVRSFEIIGGI